MAFNPLKNRQKQSSEPPLPSEDTANLRSADKTNHNINNINNDVQHLDHIDIINNELNSLNMPDYEDIPMVDDDITQSSLLSAQAQELKQQEPLSYEGQSISDLQQTGLPTAELAEPSVSTTKPTEKNKFNLTLLEALPLAFVLEKLGAVKVEDKANLYSVLGNEVSLSGNKWYNTTLKRGQVNAISLTKHLAAIKDNVDEKDPQRQKSLFIKACKFLDEIQHQQSENDLQNNQHNKVAPAPQQNNSVSVSTPTSQEVSEKKKNWVQRTPEENKAYWAALTDQLNNITLSSVMEFIGAHNNEDGQRGKWKVWSTGDNIQITGQKWKSWKAGGGIGAISLLAYHFSIVHNIDTRLDDQKKVARMMAIKALMKEFDIGDPSNMADPEDSIVLKVPFAMPHIIDFKINHVRHYLNDKRGIPMWIIDKQIKVGSLFAGYPSDWKENKNLKKPDVLTDEDVWATFLSANGTAAEMRGIARSDSLAKLLAKGSDKELGGFLIRAEREVSEKTVSALEASVDALSYHAIYPGRIATSCMGVTFTLAAKAAFDALANNYNFQLAFDNDQTGNEAALRFRETLIQLLGEENREDLMDKYKETFKEDMILQSGIEQYNQVIQDNRIQYFDLGLRCLEESARVNKVFYLDAQDGEDGINIVKLFQDQAAKRFGKEQVKEWVTNGTLKYLNVCPQFEMIVDMEKEVQVAISKLESGKPYYLRIKDDEDDKPEVAARKEDFENRLRENLGDKYLAWEKNGLIHYKKDAIAKDWNEYFIYLKENNLEFKQSIQEQEIKYAHYSEKEETNSKKKKKP